MQTRSATLDDVPGLVALIARYERHFHSVAETSENEVREFVARSESLERDSLLVLDGDQIVGAGMRWRSDTMLVVDPALEAGPVHRDLLDWFAAGDPAQVEALERDTVLRSVLEAAGWTYRKSSFVLLRDVTPDLALDEPRWPPGITLGEFDPADAATVHRLIYVDAAWTQVPGHPHRDLDEWSTIFLTPSTRPDQQVLAYRDGRLVGIALGRIWDDGTGWIAQLATATDERGKGLGRAMLREALRRRVAAGATSLGLSVQADNRGALAMYLEAGLRIDRESLEYAPAG